MNETPLKSRVSDHLANERTYLAWVRTSVALMGFGVLIARLRAEGTPRTGHGVALGLLFAAAGIVTSLLATVHYFQVRHAIDTDDFQPLTRAILVVTTAVVLVGLGAVFLLLGQSNP